MALDGPAAGPAAIATCQKRFKPLDWNPLKQPQPHHEGFADSTVLVELFGSGDRRQPLSFQIEAETGNILPTNPLNVT